MKSFRQKTIQETCNARCLVGRTVYWMPYRCSKNIGSKEWASKIVSGKVDRYVETNDSFSLYVYIKNQTYPSIVDVRNVYTSTQDVYLSFLDKTFRR